MVKEDDAALEDLLCFAVYSTEHAFTQFYRPLLTEMGVTYPQYLVLTLLWGEDDRTVGAIGAALGLQSNTLTPVLKRLEAMDLVRRDRDSRDERVVRVSLTEKGQALRTNAARIRGCVAEATGMSATEIEQAAKTIRRLRNSLAAAAPPT